MIFPSPTDPAKAPVWDNYLTAQASQATLGLIPVNALAVGVRVDGIDVTLQFQMTRVDQADQSDIDDIVDELQALVGEDVAVTHRVEVRDEVRLDPHDGIRWVYKARSD